MKKTAKKADAKKTTVKPVSGKGDPRDKKTAAQEEPEIVAKPMPKNRLPAKEKTEIREMLMAMRESLSTRIKSLKSESLARQDEVLDVEDGSDAFERQFSLNIASSENDALFEIDDAVRRLEDSTYGVCEQCHCVIEKLRLKALPFVRLCVRCQSENEKGKPKFKPMNEDEGI